MMGSFLKPLNYMTLLLIVLILFISTFFSSVISDGKVVDSHAEIMENMEISNSGFIWPIPGYTKITSPFGRRASPTSGASSYHSGIDIGAPEGTKLIAVVSRNNYFYRFFRWRRIYHYYF